jgi:phosphohistidine swiveling domain-containing protein
MEEGVMQVEIGTQYLLELSSLSLEDGQRAGSKAANEAEMLKAGFPVPDGIVLTTEAFERFLTHNHLARQSTPQTIASAAIPSDVGEALHSALAALGDGPLAVRSSGIAEDLPQASFAGQYETILNVRGLEALEAAVLRCWASAFNERILAYRDAHGQLASGMALLIQPMVPAQVAGVAFSANPVTGDRDEVVINAVRGLGERLVSGEASPDEWLVKNGQVKCQRAPQGAITAGRARDIAAMARQVEAHFGAPQDVEWAMADDQLYLLQARPITTLPAESPERIPISIEVPPGFWQHDASRFPTPPCPLFWLAAQAAVPGARLWAEEFGLLLEELEIAVIGGWPYQRMKPLGGKEPPPVSLPRPLMWLLVRLAPMMRARLKRAREAVRTDKAGRFVRQWYEQWLPEVEAQIGELRDTDLLHLSDPTLIQHFEGLFAFLTHTLEIHQPLVFSVNLILYQFVSACRELLGWDESQAFEMLTGTSYKSTEPARRLNQLAQMARERPALRKLLEQVDERSVDRLPDVDREFAEAFNSYQRIYGCRSIRTGIMDPTLAERPALSLSLIRGQIMRGYDPALEKEELKQKRSNKAAKARAMLAGDPQALTRFDRQLERAEMAYPVREDNNFYTFSAPIALIRFAALEIGSRLATRRVIAGREDVFYLFKEEACSVLLEGGDQRALVRHRKGERAWALANPGPPFYGPPPAPPIFDFLPAEARLIMQALIWGFDQMMEYEGSKQTQDRGERLAGIAASPGQYSGPVRIIMDESQFHKIQPGDVMVCPMTSPVWSVLFPSIGALVADAGGLLSHPAIIAREYRVPAVVATGNATALLRDGEMVSVDGTAGTVQCLA